MADAVKTISQIMQKSRDLHSEIIGRVALLDVKAEYGELLKLMKCLEKRGEYI